MRENQNVNLFGNYAVSLPFFKKNDTNHKDVDEDVDDNDDGVCVYV